VLNEEDELSTEGIRSALMVKIKGRKMNTMEILRNI
jgi:hypothetical protein